jgi:uncharacterized protein YjiS (DUF1127 family)
MRSYVQHHEWVSAHRGLPAFQGGTAASVERLLGRLLPGVVRALRRAQERSELLRLDERELRDIGLTAAEAQAEAAKPIWRA